MVTDHLINSGKTSPRYVDNTAIPIYWGLPKPIFFKFFGLEEGWQNSSWLVAKLLIIVEEIISRVKT